jgi:ABC-2 type transport system permease protein
LRAALAVLGGVAAALAGGSGAVVGTVGTVGGVEAVTWPGALTFGAVLGTTFLLVGVGTVVLAQVVPTAGGARALGLAVVGLAFTVRALADSWDTGWLNWLTPLGLRATVRPFTDDRWWVLLAALAMTAGLARLGSALASKREYDAGLLPSRGPRRSRLPVHSALGLAARLDRRSILVWTVGVAGIGALFSAMGSGVVEQSKEQELGGFLGSQLGTADPIAGYFAYHGTVVGLVVCAFAVLSVLRYGRDEAFGRTALLLTTGARRRTPLAAQLGITAIGAAVVLAAAGLVSALIAPSVIAGSSVASRALAYTLGQWPAAMVMAAIATVLVGRWPQWSWLAWVPLAASGLLALLGELLDIPPAVRDAGIFQHVPDIASPDPQLGGLVLLLAVAVIGGALGIAGTTRRDLLAG